jgi:leader peptidase (prepilin peptidase)/N-methyltransferase
MGQYLISAFIGWVAGIVVNYLADVLPYKRRPVAPFCLRCGERIPPGIYFVWPRRCIHCEQPRSGRTWIIEFVFLIASVVIWRYPPRFGYLIGLVLLTYLGIIIVIDIEHHLILHPVSLLGVFLGFWIGVTLHGWVATVIGGVVGFGAMLAFYFLGIAFVRISARLRNQSSNENEGEGIGFGDVNFSGVTGLLLGFPGIIAGLLIAIILAGVASILYLIFMSSKGRYHSGLAIPYGPFLAISAIILLYLKDIFTV